MDKRQLSEEGTVEIDGEREKVSDKRAKQLGGGSSSTPRSTWRGEESRQQKESHEGEVAMKSELDKFYGLIDEIEVAMMTTRRHDGHLRSRAMATQKRAEGADLWFVTAEGTAKLRDLSQDPHVNLAYYRDSSREWISVSGIATITRDRNKISELYAEDWKMWFPDEGDPRHGTPDDPRLVLIGVQVHAAEFLEVNKPKPVVLYEFVKGWLTGTEPDVGEMHKLEEPRRR